MPGGDGIFSLDGAYPSSVTLGHVLAALLTVSDDTAVRLCGLVAPAAEINAILVAKGFPHTQVEPVANPNRFFLGTLHRPRDAQLLTALVGGTLLSPASTDALLTRLRAPIAFTDGIRREMSSAERPRVATKAGWFDAARHEAGVMFDAAGAPVLTYVLFSDGAPDAGQLRRHPPGRGGPGGDGARLPRRGGPARRRRGGAPRQGPGVPAVERRMMVRCASC